MTKRRQNNRVGGSSTAADDLILTIDIAHPPLSGQEAEDCLSEALRAVALSRSLRILRIIHGYGSGGRGGALKLVTDNWSHQHRSRFRAAVRGEDCSPFHPVAQQLASECGVSTNDLCSGGDGVTILWVR